MMSPDFQHILRVLNTNIDGRRKVMFALTKIQGIGRRFSNLICKKAEVNPDKRYYNFFSFDFVSCEPYVS